MSANQNPYKFVALVNKNLEPGVALNALGHAALGMGATLAVSHVAEMQLLDFRDRDGQSHPSISALSLIVLRGTSGNIRALRKEANARSLPYVDFTTTMTCGNYTEQLERTAQTPEEDLEYSVIILFGESDVLASLTKKYSLYR